MRQDYLISIGLALASVFLFGAALMLGPVGAALFFFAPMPLMVLGFLKGARPVPLAATAGSALILFTAGLALFIVYSVMIALPVMMSMRVALHAQAKANANPNAPGASFGLGEVITALSLTAAVVLVGVSAVFSSDTAGLEVLIAQLVNQMAADPYNASGIDFTPLFDVLKTLGPSIAASGWVLNAVINLLLAQRLAARYTPVHPVPGLSMREVKLPGFAPFLLCIALAGSVVLEGEAGYTAFNAALILTLPFVALGFSVVHRFADGKSYGTLLLVVFYIVAFLSFWAPVLIAILGVIEHFLQIRSAAQQRGS